MKLFTILSACIVFFLFSIFSLAGEPIQVVTCSGTSKAHGKVKATYTHDVYKVNGEEVLGQTVVEKLEGNPGKWVELKTFYSHVLGKGRFHQLVIQHAVKEGDRWGRDLRFELFVLENNNGLIPGSLSFSLDGSPIHPDTHERFTAECTIEDKVKQ